MSISIRRLTPHIGGEVTGIDIRKPLSAEDAAAIHAGMDEYAVLVFRTQPMTREQQLAFTEALGPLELSGGTNLKKPEEYRLPTTFADVSNLDIDEKPMARDDRRRLFAIGNQLWHSDSSFKATPAKYSLLHSISLPSKGGNTEFASMVAAWDSLDDELKAECEGLVCEHSQMFSRQQIGFFDFTEEEKKRFKPVRQALVRTSPTTGRKSIYLASHAGCVVGWPVPESRIFLRNLIEHATQPQFVYVHKWQVGDLVMWDNRQTMHRVRAFPAHEPRDMRRTTIAGDGPTVAQAEAA
jgi:alpha-ketoglutarate-dependent 2,4-dichlorophenoxyacetate dioxygenase